MIQNDCIDEIISPLKKQLDECKKKTFDKDSELKKKKLEKNHLEQEKKEISAQMEQIKLL